MKLRPTCPSPNNILYYHAYRCHTSEFYMRDVCDFYITILSSEISTFYDMLTLTHFKSAQRSSSRRICTHDVKLEYLFVEKLEACLQFIIRLSMSVCDSDERFGCSNQPTNQPIDQPREHTEVVKKTMLGDATYDWVMFKNCFKTHVYA